NEHRGYGGARGGRSHRHVDSWQDGAESYAAGKCDRESRRTGALPSACDPFAWAFNYDYQGRLDRLGKKTGTPCWRPSSNSIVEITGFELQQFTVDIKELAEWFGLEVARIVVDECLPSREK